MALVWTVESLKLLRGYGLTGSFTGTLAQFPQQNIFLGLPVQLLPEEVVFLLRRGWGVVVDERASYHKAGVEQVALVEERVTRDKESQQLSAWHERQLLKAKHATKSDRTAPPPPTTSTKADKSAATTPAQEELAVLPWHYTIATTSTSLPWYAPWTYTTLSSVQPIFAYPSTELEVASVGLFEHLVGSKGLWCMNGLRFGGAFAVYPGDPLRYHSHYTAQLVLKDEQIALTSLVANGRLGTAVKKTHLLCAVESFDPALDLNQTAQQAAGGSTRSALTSICSGVYDVAPTSPGPEKDDKTQTTQRPKRFAEFNIFSLAWAGFGT